MKIGALITIAALSFVATFATTCIERPVYSREEMKNHWLGYPVPFLRQDIRRYDPETFPQYFRLDSPRSSPTIAIELERLFLSWAIIFGVAWLVTWSCGRALQRLRSVHAT